MKEYYYCLDGLTSDGPHSEGEIIELFQTGVLKPETLFCAAGDKDWTTLKASNLNFDRPPAAPTSPPLDKKVVAEQVPVSAPVQAVENSTASAPPKDADIVTVDHSAIASAGNDGDSEEEKDEKKTEAEDRGLGKYQLIRAIRADLDSFGKHSENP